MIRRNNSDFNYINNRYINREKNEQNYQKNPNEYYHDEDTNNRYNHYSPENNNYGGSRYGDYTYNYYLNSPMRGDRSEDWRFPPVYQYQGNNNYKKNIF